MPQATITQEGYFVVLQNHARMAGQITYRDPIEVNINIRLTNGSRETILAGL